MVKQIKVDDTIYNVTNEEIISVSDELIFEIDIPSFGTTYTIALWDDMLGSPIKEIWKIIK
jgi:hypothetical protein